jgi:hypothetical protein
MVSLTKLLLYGIVGAFAISALVYPNRAYATTQAFGGIGSALGNLGTGLLQLGTGAGTGAAKLLNPLFTLRDLIFPQQGGAQPSTLVTEESRLGQITNTPQQVQATAAGQFNPPGWTGQQDYGTPGTPTTAPYIPGAPRFTFTSSPEISSVPTAAATVHGQDVPLSQSAIDYYNKIGVDVSPSSNQTVSSTNSQNATSPGSVSFTSSGHSGFWSGGGFRAAN